MSGSGSGVLRKRAVSATLATHLPRGFTLPRCSHYRTQLSARLHCAAAQQGLLLLSASYRRGILTGGPLQLLDRPVNVTLSSYCSCSSEACIAQESTLANLEN